ncbi:NAD+ synthase [Candidatus Magnetaquicoccus inordinatus]|uniref:NAD+ synthase n=1 Tax=Candidatus Magnetaquicoccus inordinatus TaxID=2496818 RepID=UPI003B96955C
MEFILAIAQVNPHVGALQENMRMMLRQIRAAQAAGAALVVFPELVLTGYPPEDLLLKPLFLQRLAEVEQQLHRELATSGVDVIYGTVRHGGEGLFNAGVFVWAGQEVGYAAKWRLPNYSVFDEQRYFVAGDRVQIFPYRGVMLGITICEDMWHTGEPLASLAAQGASLIINLNASPYHVGKQQEREEIIRQRIAEHGLPVVYVNQVGGQDELVFDGGSFVMSQDEHGAVQRIVRCQFCAEDLRFVRVGARMEAPILLQALALEAKEAESEGTVEEEVYQALCLGLRDYVGKNGFSGVVLGLSGGIDSALTAVICADTLGAERVEALMMPSRFTSVDSLEDAAEEAAILGIRLSEISIDPLFAQFRQQLAPLWQQEGETAVGEDVTDENIQPRIRATLLMAVANKRSKLLITTGNKSEMSVGYATLYGDMAGGFSVLKDLLKDMVYRLAAARNRWAVARGQRPPIPERVMHKPPTAELRPNQKDSDSLPPYPILDAILERYVEQEQSPEQIVAAGLDAETVRQVIVRVDRNEYKRRQAPPGVRITRRAFGKDRRYPLTNGFSVR